MFIKKLHFGKQISKQQSIGVLLPNQSLVNSSTRKPEDTLDPHFSCLLGFQLEHAVHKNNLFDF